MAPKHVSPVLAILFLLLSLPIVEAKQSDLETKKKRTPKTEWGHLRGRFEFSGKIPPAKLLTISQDKAHCGNHTLYDESLVVDPNKKGISNIFISLRLKRGKKIASHEDYAETLKTAITLDNTQCQFVPHALFIRTGQVLEIRNLDKVGHNTRINTPKNSTINPMIPAGGILKHQFTKGESIPAEVSCSVHPWMSAWIWVVDHPYVALTDSQGNFEIRNLPAGEWTFQVWHEKSGYLKEVTHNGKLTTFKRGRFTATIEGGKTNDLGTLSVNSTTFK
ncbi:MAG: carboxypeptidase regulatory-like domain-containing protein [Pirellulaceae bacterium]|nr:carboxypeptidase regulatory-like domain-containing protein [Pirellulaceae bacterium]